MWAASSNLLLNGSKTKQMPITTQQMPLAHGLKDEVPTITVKGKVLERKASFKLLGKWLDEHLNWTDHIKHLSIFVVLRRFVRSSKTEELSSI